MAKKITAKVPKRKLETVRERTEQTNNAKPKSRTKLRMYVPFEQIIEKSISGKLVVSISNFETSTSLDLISISESVTPFLANSYSLFPFT